MIGRRTDVERSPHDFLSLRSTVGNVDRNNVENHEIASKTEKKTDLACHV